MTLIPELHDALARAVAAPRPARGRWWRPSRRAGLLAVGAVVVTGSALAATTGWHPVLGHQGRDRPREANNGVPAAQLAALGVLRREQTNADRGPQVQAVLRLLMRQEINGIHTDAIRTLRRQRNLVTMLVPVERVGRRLPDHPSSVQRHVLCVFYGVQNTPPTTTVKDHGKTRTVPNLTGDGPSAGSVCGDLNRLHTTGIGAATRTDNGTWLTSALVPNGVARVIVRLRHHRKVTATVHDNYYEVNTGDEIAPAWGVRWLDSQGNTIDHRRDTSP